MRATMRSLLALGGAAMLCGVALARPVQAQTTASSDYLYLWTASGDSTRSDYLAVLDARRGSATYGKLVDTVPVPGHGNVPHHTEHAMPANGRLFANGFASGRTFIFDARDRAHPRLDGQFGDIAGMMHPHSYLRLPNGNVLATFQMRHDSLGPAPGGLAELTSTGQVVRSASADVAGVDRRIRPYSAAIVPALDRIVTTTTDMVGDTLVRAVQLWRLSDLALLKTFDLPPGPRGDESALTAEPRLLGDGRTVLVSTFNCGLYMLSGLDTDSPSGRLVSSFPRKDGTDCAVPVVAGHFYLITVPAWKAVVSLDVSDPAHPREVSRMVLGDGDVPHWISLEPNRRRIVITGYGTLAHRAVMVGFDPATGHIALDEAFRGAGAAEPGVRLTGLPHGAVFANSP